MQGLRSHFQTVAGIHCTVITPRARGVVLGLGPELAGNKPKALPLALSLQSQLRSVEVLVLAMEIKQQKGNK